MDEHLACGAAGEGNDDVNVGDVGQLVALFGEALNVLSESLARLLPAVMQTQEFLCRV